MRRVLHFVVLLAGLAAATPASGHAVLVATDPPEGALLSEPPRTLTLIFNEPVEPTAMRLLGPDGATTELSDFGRSGLEVVVRPPAFAEGTHVLSWRVVSADGHPVAGALLFSVGIVTGTTEAVVSSDPLLGPLIWAARFVLYLGLFVGIAGVFFAVWIAAPYPLPPAARTILRAAMVAGLVAAPIAFSLQGADLIGASVPSAFSPASWTASLKSTYTATLIAAVIALAAGLVGLLRSSHILSGAAFLAVATAFALSGHASRAPPLALTWLVVFIHTGAVAFWTGALLPLVFLLRDPDRGAVAALSRFSAVIPHAIAPLIVAGAILIVVQLDSVSDLWTTDYGRILAAKLAAVVALFALAVLNRYRLTPAFRQKPAAGAAVLRRSILAEAILVLAVFALVAGWRFSPPPRAIVEATPIRISAPPFFTHLHGADLAADVTVTPGSTGPVVVRVVLYDAELVPLPATALTVAFSNAEAGIGPIERPAIVDADGIWEARGFVLPLAGTWTIELTARISTFDQRTISAGVAIVDPRLAE